MILVLKVSYLVSQIEPFMVSGQLFSEENCLPVRVGVWVKVRVILGLGATRQLPSRKTASRLGLGFGLGLVLGLGPILLRGIFPRINFNIAERITLKVVLTSIIKQLLLILFLAHRDLLMGRIKKKQKKLKKSNVFLQRLTNGK